MRKNRLGRGCVLVVMLLFVQVVVLAGPLEQVASKMHLDQDLFVTLDVKVDGAKLKLFIVAVTDRALHSKVSAKLKEELRPYVGKNVLYVNPTVEDVVSSFPFHPSNFKISQEGVPDFVPTLADWVEISDGFLSGKFVMNPGGASYGSGSEGLLLMNGHIDITKPFTVSYGGQSATFAIKENYVPPATSTTGAIASSPAQPPVDVPIPAQVTDMQDALTTGEFTAERMASLFSLPPALVRTLDITMRSSELRLLLVLLSDAVRDASFSSDLLTSIEPLIGTGAVMVWAISPTGSAFTKWMFFLQQNKTVCQFFSDSSFVELTPGFISAKEVSAGQVLAGVIRFPKWMDSSAPFEVFYGSDSVTFNAQ